RCKELAEYCKKNYAETEKVLNSIPSEEKKNAIFLQGVDALNVIAKSSFQAKALDDIVNNLAVLQDSNNKGSGSEVDFEQIATWNPDYILLDQGTKADTITTDPRWQSIKAVQLGNIIIVPNVPYGWLTTPPGFNQLLGLTYFAHLLYPEKFDKRADQVTEEFFKAFYE
ncbi:MAG: ABC transporter substrate-binding protein, partial [Eggerthellaceae bacterium]|nr:ABC transporter substrate-binding protein [Eggerthellaceae bacterium]